MDNPGSDAEENIASCEETSSEEAIDVKVCDICGYVGEEKKLAVCSRCNDGAEHTYCMRIMIEEVPEGEWLCEDCQKHVENEKKKKKLEKSQLKIGTNLSENKVEAENVGHKETSKELHGNGISRKRKERNADPSFPNELQMPTERSDDSNLKSLDGERYRLGKGDNDVSSPSEVKYMSNAAATSKMLDTSSNARSSKVVEDVKVCDVCGVAGEEKKLVVCSRCNDGAEHIYCMRVMMEEVPEANWFCGACQTDVEAEKKKKKLEKSQVTVRATKEVTLEGQMNIPVTAPESRNSSENAMEAENMSSKELNLGDQRNGMATKMKEKVARSTSAIRQSLSIEIDSEKNVSLPRESSLKLDGKKGKGSADQMPISFPSNDPKDQAVPLPGQLSKSISFNNSKVPKVKQLVMEFPLKPRKLEEAVQKQKGPMSALAKSTSFKMPNSSEPANKGKSSILIHAEEPRVMNSLMKGNVINKRGTSMAATVPSRVESAAQHLNNGNNMDNLGMAYGKGEPMKSLAAKGPGSTTLTNEQNMRNGLSTTSSTASVDCPKLKFEEHQDVSARGRRFVDSSSTISSDLKDEKLILSPSDDQMASTFPELAYTWQGSFELWRTGRPPEFCEGLQAHLSCSASPKVLEIATNFPSQIQLEVLPRQNLRPSQFRENGPMYDKIGLFFFARDTQSYENHYSKLVQKMLKYDLALRGNTETAELLIYSSNILPKNFRRWNMFYYLWGVFRVRRKDQNLPARAPLSKCSNDSVAASSSTNNNTDTNEFDTAPAGKNQILAYSGHRDTILGSSDGDDDLMDVDYVNITEASLRNADHISHRLGGAHKRNVQMVNWAGEANVSHKKTKLENGGFVN